MLKENYILKILNAGINETSKKEDDCSKSDPNKTIELSDICKSLLKSYHNGVCIKKEIIDRLEAIKNHGTLHYEVYIVTKELKEDGA